MKRRMTKSGVPWADYRWNPIEGCSPMSTGCKNCYAAGFAKRFHRVWGRPVFHAEKLVEPVNTKRPGLVFVCSTSDFWHQGVKLAWRDLMFEVMKMASWHTYLILTKRPVNIPSEFVCPENVWLGVTCETQALADYRWPILSKIRAPVRFVSVEPMLEPVSFMETEAIILPDWVICGPENGPHKRKCDPKWIDRLSWEHSDDRPGRYFFDKRKDAVRQEFPPVKGER